MSVRLFALNKSLRSHENHTFPLMDSFSSEVFYWSRIVIFTCISSSSSFSYLFIPVYNRFRFKQNETNHRNRTYSKRTVNELMLFLFLIFSLRPLLQSTKHREAVVRESPISLVITLVKRNSRDSSSTRGSTSEKWSFEKVVLWWSNFSFLALAKKSSRDSSCDSSSPREITSEKWSFEKVVFPNVESNFFDGLATGFPAK